MKKSTRQQLIDAIKHSEGYHGRVYNENLPEYVFNGHPKVVAEKINKWQREQMEKRAVVKLETCTGTVSVCARQFMEVLQIASGAVGFNVDGDGLHVRDGNFKWDFKPLNYLDADFTVSTLTPAPFTEVVG